jgi:hypothetical protein
VDRAEEYRQKAEDAEEWAASTSDPVVAKRFRELAAQWRALAEASLRIDFELPPSPIIKN